MRRTANDRRMDSSVRWNDGAWSGRWRCMRGLVPGSARLPRPSLRHTRACRGYLAERGTKPLPTSDHSHPWTIAPNLIWGPNPTPFTARWTESSCQRHLQDRSVPRCRQRSSFGPQIKFGATDLEATAWWMGVRAWRRRPGGEITAAERGNDGSGRGYDGKGVGCREGGGGDGTRAGCWSRRDTRGKRGYDGGGGAAMTEWVGQRRTLRVFWRGCWHLGHQWVARPPTMVRRMGVWHSSQGSLVRRKTRT